MRNKILSFFRSVLEDKKETKFCSAGVLTLGAEVELQIIDKNTLELSSNAEEMLRRSSAITRKIVPELYLSTIEINTDKCNDVIEIEKDLEESFDIIAKIADEMNVALSTSGCHPFSRYADCVPTPSKRYDELIDRNQWLAKRMTVYALHVHIGMKSGDDAIRFNNFFLNFIPHFLALSSSSPFWQGYDTGLSACRPITFESLPTAGYPYRVNDWREFEHLYETLVKCGSVKSLKDLWWDIRPSPHYGTLEIRICDGLTNLSETTALIAFIHLLANWFNDNANWLEKVPLQPLWFARENKWRGIRYGLDATLVVNLDGETKPIRQDILEWLEKLAPYEKKLGYEKYVTAIRDIVNKGNSTIRQRKVFEETNSLQDVVRLNVKEFINKKPIW